MIEEGKTTAAKGRKAYSPATSLKGGISWLIAQGDPNIPDKVSCAVLPSTRQDVQCGHGKVSEFVYDLREK